MESVYKLSVILNLVDNLSGQMNSVQSSVSGSVDKLNSAFGTMQKAGVAMAGIGGTITGLAMKTVTATFDTQNALGELSSLGVKDLKAVEDAAKSFSNTWAGTSKADFITASYDIKSGMQPCEEAYSIRKTLEQYRMVIDYFDYLKLNGLWKLTGSRLMDAQRTEYTTKQAYSFGVEHTREFRVIWHEEHNLIFLDGTWSLDGSKIIDAWQKTEVL